LNIQYLEIVTENVDAACDAYATAFGTNFGEPVEVLGNARLAIRPDGSMIGVRAAMSGAETPIVRPYWLVDNIESSVELIVAAGGEIIHPPLELVGYGTFAIYIQGGVQNGLWQL